MFTGLIEATGRVEAVDVHETGRRLVVSAPFAADLCAGDSVAVSGVCLTVIRATRTTFSADLSRTTLEATSLGSIRAGRLVNLERPLCADARLGGHFVLGHVDQATPIVELRPDGDGCWLRVAVPPALEALVIPKGSIAIDGISLTVASLEDRFIGLQIIPFTFVHTALSEAETGDVVNLEVDVLGKYVARFLAVGREPAGGRHPLERQLP